MSEIKTICVFLLILLIGCSSDELNVEERNYLAAKSEKNLNDVFYILKELNNIDPNKYEFEFTQISQAKTKLHLAEKALSENDFFNAFSLSQKSFQLFNSNEAKQVLVKSGKILLPLIKSQYMVRQAFQEKPVNLDKQLNTLISQDIPQWNLIDTNALFNQLTVSANNLSKSINIINENHQTLGSLEVSEWRDDLIKQYEILHNSRQFILAYSMKGAAKKLKIINSSLAKDAGPLFASIAPENALNAMQPLFRTTFKAYFSYQNLMENLYLSADKSELFKDNLWYEPWKNLESDIFMPKDKLEAYADSANLRNTKIDHIVTKYRIEKPALIDDMVSIEILNNKHKALHTTIANLTSHQAILY